MTLKQITRLLCVLTLCATTCLTAYSQTDTIVLKTKQVDEIIDRLAASNGYKNGFDSLRAWYNELVNKYEQSQSNVIRLLNERDTAIKYERLMQDNYKAEMVRADAMEAKYYKAYNKAHKQLGIDLHPIGYNPIAKSFYTGIGISIRLLGVNLFPKSKSEMYVPTNDTEFNRLFNR